MIELKECYLLNGISNGEQENRAVFSSSGDEQSKFGCIAGLCMSLSESQTSHPDFSKILATIVTQKLHMHTLTWTRDIELALLNRKNKLKENKGEKNQVRDVEITHQGKIGRLLSLQIFLCVDFHGFHGGKAETRAPRLHSVLLLVGFYEQKLD